MAWISACFHGVDGSSVVKSTSRTTIIPTADIMKIINSIVLTVPSSSVAFGTYRSLSQNHHYGAINYRTISSSSLISGCLIIVVPKTPILTQRTSLGSSYVDILSLKPRASEGSRERYVTIVGWSVPHH